MGCKHFFVRLAITLVATSTAWADPCGMVPPAYVGEGVAITRVGTQKTFVFFKDGVESIVIRPGFSGKVDEFGMLIPFPTPPAIRKVPDDIFSHIAAAIDPPEVVVDLTPSLGFGGGGGGGFGGFGGGGGLGGGERPLRFDEVRVVKQEAIGMYEVAVLEAGSAVALKKWVDDHGFRYPEGMDKTCDEYVQQHWCFVAVKTRVGQQAGVEPKPGQRQVRSKLPEGATFDGNVQAMGFRFRSKKLVVPMRLSAFNSGELHNIVYLLTDRRKRIRSIPTKFVVRQIQGKELFRNLTRLLPMRIIGGSKRKISRSRRKKLPGERDPAPHNGAARDLFASDLLAVRNGVLSHAHEETEKVFLRVGERLGLRGNEIDRLNSQSLADLRRKKTDAALTDVKSMSLTVIDGDFSRPVLAGQNLTFANYRMSSRRNRSEFYDAKLQGPTGKRPGIRVVGQLPDPSQNLGSRIVGIEASSVSKLGLLALCAVGLILTRRKTAGGVFRLVACLAIGIATFCVVSLAMAQDDKPEASRLSIRELLAHLGDPNKDETAVASLVQLGDKAVPLLQGEALEGNDLARRGWAIIALAEIAPRGCDEFFLKIHSDKRQPPLVRTWAAAARVSMTKSAEGLIEKAALVTSFPALGRPIGMRLVEKLSSAGGGASAEEILSISLKVPKLQQAIAPAILALGAQRLTAVMIGARVQNVRRKAASYLGTLANQGDKAVPQSVIKAYSFDPATKDVAWSGGPLFLPGFRWQKEDARALVGNLVAWHLWCDRHSKRDEQNQIANNLASTQLAQYAEFQIPSSNHVTTAQWLEAWGRVVGRAQIEKMLKAQGVENARRYRSVLKKLPKS